MRNATIFGLLTLFKGEGTLWRFTYDHVMLIYGKAIDEQGKSYYMVKNSWGESGQYKGIWYMSRDYMTLNTTYLFLNRHALPNTIWTQGR